MLLKAGMSIRQALMYNIISSVLALLGMVIGVMLGNISSASLWIFALAGGMFIYISLVDMVSVWGLGGGRGVCYEVDLCNL